MPLIWLLIYLGLIFTLSQFALTFAVITTVTSFLVFAKIEADQNVYDLGFWFTEYPSARLLFFFRAFGKLEAVVRSLLLGLLTWFTFAGDDTGRIMDAAWRLCIAVFCSYWFLYFLARKAHLNVLRWAYVKLSIFIGIVFGVLSVIFRKQRNLFVESIKGLWPFGAEPSTDQKVEKIHRAIDNGSLVVQDKLNDVIGEFWANVVMAIFSTQILHGFLVVLFTFSILLLTMPSLRKRPETKGVTPEAESQETG